MRRRKFAIALRNFDPDAVLIENATHKRVPCSFLSLSIGDKLVVFAENDGWCYGHRIASPAECGLFPENSIFEVNRAAISGCTSDGISLVEEINSVIQQWWTRVKELYARHTELHWQDEVITSIDEMMRARKKILSGGVPAEELNSLRNVISPKIDRGNMLLSLNVTIRKDNGAPHEQDAISIIENYNEHRAAQRGSSSDPRECEFDASGGYHALLFHVESVVLNQKYDCEFVTCLYDIENREFVSECFRYVWRADSRKFEDPAKCIFVDLRKEERTKRFVFITRVAKIAPIEGTSSTLKKQQDPGPPSLFCRQMISFDITDIDTFYRSLHSNNEKQEKVVWFNREDTFHEGLHRYDILNKLVKNVTTNKPDESYKMMISCQFLPGTTDTLHTKHPHVFARSPPVVIKRTELSNGSSAEELRNELFVTLDHAEISGKSSEKNIEVRLTVVSNGPSVVQNCFECAEPSGIKKRSSYRAYVYTHEDKPKWTELIKIRLPEDTSSDVHLKMAFHYRRPYDKNKPEKGPYAIAYAKIMENATLIKDGEHDLLVYKVESSHYDEMNISYLSLPENKKILKDLGPGGKSPQTSVFSLSEKSSLVIQTKSCSSILTHNQNLLTIFRWRQNSTTLGSALASVSSPHGHMEGELMKNMSTFLDTIFEIWEDRESLELSLFDALVAVLRLSEEPQHVRTVAILQGYIDKFPYTSASLKLIRCVNHYISSIDSSKNDKTRNTLKVLGKLTQLIVNSKRSADSLSVEVVSFEAMIDALLNSFVGLMGEQGDRMTVQNTALKHLPLIVAPLLIVYDPVRLAKHLVRIMDNFGPNIVARERLGFVSQIVGDELFENNLCRHILLPKCVEQILFHVDQDVEVSGERDYAEKAMECGNIISNMVDKLWPMNGIQYGTDDELSYIIVCCYRPVVRTMVELNHLSIDVADIRACLFTLVLALLQKMSAQTFGQYIESREQAIDRMDFLMEMVQMLRDLLTRSPYPSTWTTLIFAQNKIVHKTLRFVMSAVQQFFSNDSFYSDLWQEYMVTLVCFVTQVSLQPEGEWLGDDADVRFSLRKAAAKDLRSMWFRLTPTQKMSYIPRLVGAFLKVALIDDDEIREATIPIFFDMMQCEYHSTVHEHKNFKKFCDELIVQLDCLVDQDRGTRAFQQQFTRSMTTQCDSDKELWVGGGRDFIGRVDRLLGHLFEYRLVRETSDCMENGMSRTVQLLRYYEQYGHYELQISYVYKLYDLHMLYGNEIEAAYTLMLHAKQLSWEDVELPDFLIQKSLNRHCGSERQLKDHLLNEIADLLAEGDMWENAIEILKELEPIYKNIYFDYDKVANLLDRTATLYRKIEKEHRAYFYFYLVSFYGKGFPSYLNGKRFVFRSDKLEMYGDFIQRMKQIYGGPEEIAKMDDCSHLENAPGRYMQVFNIDPIGVKKDFGSHVNPAIKEYYRHYNIQKFEYSRGQQFKESKWTEIECSDIMITWISKRIVATNESLPTILRFSQVVSVSEPIMVSPLERAVHNVKAKNEKLMEAALLVLKNPMQSVRNFSGDVLGVVRPAVMGGVKNYEIFFEDRCSKIYDHEEKRLALHLSALIVEQVEIAEFCIYAHGTRAEADRKIHEAMIDGFNEHQNYVESKFGKTSSILPTGKSIYDCAAETVQNAPLSDKKASSLSMGNTSLDDSFSTGTWKKSLQNVQNLINNVNPRKSTAGVTVAATPTTTATTNGNVRISSDRCLDNSKFDRFLRAESVDNIRRFVKASPLSLHKKHQSNSSIDGIKFRQPKKRDLPAGPAPPLPARSIKECCEMSETPPALPERPTRNRLLPDRKDKPQPPTPDR